MKKQLEANALLKSEKPMFLVFPVITIEIMDI